MANPGVPHRRSTDMSLATRIGYVYDKYKWLTALLIGFLVALGFDFKTPGSTQAEIRNEVRTNRLWTQAVFDTIVADNKKKDDKVNTVIDVLEVLSIDLCLRRMNNPYIFRKLKCSELMDGRRQ